ncbi:MAG TPA: DedA family protein [Actinomycetota bacterium]|nr:DedA family protein [Actinomycetota bacterium]
MERLIQLFIEDYGYLAVFVLMVLESACIPIPSEVTMLFGGAAANAAFAATLPGDPAPLDFLLVGLVGTLGNVVGSWIAYWVGLRGRRPLVERWGRYLLVRPHELDRAEAWFARHGHAAVFVSRLLPVVRTFISLPAGVAEMPFGKFTLYTFVGCLPWTFALAGVGYALGSQWHLVERFFRPLAYAVAAVLALAVAWWFLRRWREQRAQAPAGTGDRTGTRR